GIGFSWCSPSTSKLRRRFTDVPPVRSRIVAEPPPSGKAASSSGARPGGDGGRPRIPLPARAQTGPASVLFVAEAVGRPVEALDIEAAGLPRRGAAGDADAVSGPQGAGLEADARQLGPVVHLQAPLRAAAGAVDSDDQERMRIDELELGDRALDLDLTPRIVGPGDRMVAGLDGRGHERAQQQRGNRTRHATSLSADPG